MYDSMWLRFRGVGWKPSVAYFKHNPSKELSRLEKDLREGTYKEQKSKTFEIFIPKHRTIKSIRIRDRIYQGSLYDGALYPQTTRSFIPNNLACQRGKGTELARKRFAELIRKAYRKHGTKFYFMKCDIKGYYSNIDHEISIKELNKYIDDISAEMADRILEGEPGDKGYFPGSPIVQILGVTLLNRLDHVIKEQLRVRYYIRYMDDFILLHQDKEYLKDCKNKIESELARLKLNLNQKKTYIAPITQGIRFLGFDHRLTATGKVVILADPKKIKNERILLRRMVHKALRGEIPKEQADRHFKCWLNSITYGNSFKIIQRMRKYYKSLWEEKLNDHHQIETVTRRSQGQ